MYYSVSINKEFWTAEKVTEQEFIQKGFSIQSSRRYGDKDVFMNGRKVAVLFKSKKEAATFAFSK